MKKRKFSVFCGLLRYEVEDDDDDVRDESVINQNMKINPFMMKISTNIVTSSTNQPTEQTNHSSNKRFDDI